MQFMTKNFVACWLLNDYPLITHQLHIDFVDFIDEICLDRYKYFRENQLHYHKMAFHYDNSNSN